jgi:hypothetical protein
MLLESSIMLSRVINYAARVIKDVQIVTLQITASLTVIIMIILCLEYRPRGAENYKQSLYAFCGFQGGDLPWPVPPNLSEVKDFGPEANDE